MALEIRRTIADAHDQAILCVAYNPSRREIFTGSQDGSIKVWMSDSGELVRKLEEHKGWVTGLAYALELRVLFSCSIDGRILVWSFKGEVIQRERVGDKPAVNSDGSRGSSAAGPLYCLAWDARRKNLVAGGNGNVWVYVSAGDIDINSREKAVIKLQSQLKAHDGKGPENSAVRGIVATDSGKLYSVGYDRSIYVWDTDLAYSRLMPSKDEKKKKKTAELFSMGESRLKRISARENVHDGAISAVTFDHDNNWVITGGFDRSVKIWAGDGKRVAEIDGFSDTLTGLCYVPATKSLWMSANSAHPIVYDPRSATDITGYLQHAQSAQQQKESKERIQRLFFIRETGELVTSTNARALHIWRYNPYGAAAVLRVHSDWVEVLAYAFKRLSDEDQQQDHHSSMVLVSSGADSLVRRWEPASRMNPALYSYAEGFQGHEGAVLCCVYCEQMDMFITSGDDCTIRTWRQGDSLYTDGRGGHDEVELPRVYKEHSDRVTGLLVWGSTLASVSWDFSLRLWDLRSEKAESTHVVEDAHDDYILSAAYSAELEQIATASADQGVKLWDVSAGSDVVPYEADSAHEGSSVPEGKLGKRCCGVLLGHSSDVSHIKWLVKKRLWVSASEDRTVRLWNSLGEQVGMVTPRGDSVTALSLDQRHCHVLIATMDCALRVYKLAKPLPPPEPEEGEEGAAPASAPASAPALAPALAPAPAPAPAAQDLQLPDDVSEGEAAELVETDWRLELCGEYRGHMDAVRCILHVPEKRQYITASWDKTIRVWHAFHDDDEASALDESGLADEQGASSAAELEPGSPTSLPDEEGEVEEQGEEAGRKMTFAEKFPLVEPKWLSERDKRGAHDKFLKKTAADDQKAERRHKKIMEEESQKAVTGLSAKLADLEHSLRAQYEAPSTTSATNTRRSTRDKRRASNMRTANGLKMSSLSVSSHRNANG